MKNNLILILIIILMIPSLSFAEGRNFDFEPDLNAIGRIPPDPPTNVERNKSDDSFKEISYVISTTGGSTNIRYRTSEIRIVVAGNVYRLNTLDLQKLVPKAGETVHSLVTINAQHIIAGMNEERKKKGLGALSESEIDNIKNSLNDPSKIEIEANIDIYNKATGKILDRITDINNIAHIAGKYGFSTKHMDDMASRFVNKPLNRVITEIQEEVPKGKGLRPTGIRN